MNPSACEFLPAILQDRIPELIDFLLRLAAHAERDGVVERVMLAGTHREERLAKQTEFDATDGAVVERPHAVDARLREYAGVEPRGFLGLLDVPEMGDDAGQCAGGHGVMLM